MPSKRAAKTGASRMTKPPEQPRPGLMRCPTCATNFDAEQAEVRLHRPFCSRRCKLADLGRWLDEDYRITRPLGPDDQTN